MIHDGCWMCDGQLSRRFVQYTYSVGPHVDALYWMEITIPQWVCQKCDGGFIDGETGLVIDHSRVCAEDPDDLFGVYRRFGKRCRRMLSCDEIQAMLSRANARSAMVADAL